MPAYTVEDQPDLTIPEDTIVRARLEEISEKEIKWNDKNDGTPKSKVILEWWWEVQDEAYTDPSTGHHRKVKGTCDAKITNHPKNRFHNWSETLMGRTIAVGTPISTDDLIGLQADISIRHRKDKNDPSKIYEEVDEVMPITGGFDTDVPPF